MHDGTSIMTPKRGKVTSWPVLTRNSLATSMMAFLTKSTSSTRETIGIMSSKLPYFWWARSMALSWV